MNENLKGLFYSILIVFTGYVITILSIYLDYFGNEVVAMALNHTKLSGIRLSMNHLTVSQFYGGISPLSNLPSIPLLEVPLDTV